MESKRPKIFKRTNVNSSNEKGETDREDGEDMITDAKRDVRNRHIKTEAENISRHQTRKHTGRDDLRSRSYRAATVCLVVLCVPLLTAVIVMGAELYKMIEEFYIKNRNIINELDVLNKLKTTLQSKVDKLSECNKTLVQNSQQLQKNVNVLWDQMVKMDRWKCYQSSLYFISSEEKSWNESRQDCKERGADLIIISSKEEQEFLKTATGDSKVWIGLTDHAVEGTWKWVDDSVLNPGFWKAGKPDGSTDGEDCAINLSSGFEDHSCDKKFKWICEK